jgi:hypothetical protein
MRSGRSCSQKGTTRTEHASEREGERKRVKQIELQGMRGLIGSHDVLVDRDLLRPFPVL